MQIRNSGTTLEACGGARLFVARNAARAGLDDRGFMTPLMLATTSDIRRDIDEQRATETAPVTLDHVPVPIGAGGLVGLGQALHRGSHVPGPPASAPSSPAIATPRDARSSDAIMPPRKAASKRPCEIFDERHVWRSGKNP